MPSNRFAFVIRYLNHAAPRMQEPRAYARLLLYGNAFSGHAFGLHGNLTPPRITPRRPPLLRRLTLSEWTLPDRFRPTAKSPLAPPLLLSPSSHLTRREVLPCFNARHQDWTQVSLMLLPVMAFDAVAPHRLSRERLSDAPLIRLAGFPTAEGK